MAKEIILYDLFEIQENDNKKIKNETQRETETETETNEIRKA